MTPLFPARDHLVSIRQGKGGDCYLLSSLECLLNGDTASRAQIESMFTQTATGVELRIKPNAQSARLQKDKLAGKYEYRKDPITGDDIFIISNQRLKEIDAAYRGVRSNSLAVKILERISAYYYVGDWNQFEVLASVVAHDINNRHDKTSTEFVGDLLGFNAHNYPGSSFEKILKLQELDPNQAVYISMSYGDKDAFDQIHGRHALRLKSFAKIGYDQYRLKLINPWDNSPDKVETLVLSSAELASRKARFCVYSTDAHEHELKMMLTQCSSEQAKYALGNKELFKNLLQKKKSEGLKQDELSDLIAQHKRLSSPQRHLEGGDLHIEEIEPIIIEQKINPDVYKKRLLINPHDEELASSLLAQLKLHNMKVDPLFMHQYVIEPAASNNSKRLGSYGIEAERSNIYSALVGYHFLGAQAENSLTRSMQLRFYLASGVFPQDEINKLFTPSQLMTLTLANCLTDLSFEILLQSSRANSLKDYVQNIDFTHIDKRCVEELMARTNLGSIGNLNRRLTTIAAINPSLAQQIIEVQLGVEPPSLAKERIMSLQSVEGRLRIERNARKLLEPITTITAHFREYDSNTVQNITARKRELIDQVLELAKDPQMIAADDTLRLLGKESLVKQKIAEIEKKGAFHEKNLLLKAEKIKILQAINFTSRLNTIEQMKERLVREAKTNSNYDRAATRAKVLCGRLDRIHKQFLNDPTMSTSTFKEEVGEEIKGALDVLKVHRGWKKILESLANAIVSLAEAMGLKSKNSRWSLLEVKTESRKTAEEFVESINKLSH
ncbi:hypothetical protein [Legionella sp. km772]|uniref:hypothetical protein n=1 Tax=Legionella sp. km772 TaxID=2498111 RepID=UPI000F8EF9DA|nr:hypothetical protein [Legionella sp. km772]RUR09651.1 hypothetical protein ELY15_08960 [Legionella sp. km772]